MSSLERDFLDSWMIPTSFIRMTVKQTWRERLRWWDQQYKVNGYLIAPRGRRWETDEEFRQRIHLSLPSTSGQLA